MQNEELLPVPEHPEKWILVLIVGCVLLSWVILLGFGLEESKAKQSTGNWENSETIEPGIYDYSNLIETYKAPGSGISFSGILYWFIPYALLQLVLIAIVIYLGKGCGAYCLLLVLQGSLCWGVAMMNFENSGTYLYHDQTVEFDGQVYHLTTEKEWATDPSWEKWSVLLFECDATSERCNLLHRESDYNTPSNTSLEINEVSNQLEMYVEGALVYEIYATP